MIRTARFISQPNDTILHQFSVPRSSMQMPLLKLHDLQSCSLRHSTLSMLLFSFPSFFCSLAHSRSPRPAALLPWHFYCRQENWNVIHKMMNFCVKYKVNVYLLHIRVTPIPLRIHTYSGFALESTAGLLQRPNKSAEHRKKFECICVFDYSHQVNEFGMHFAIDQLIHGAASVHPAFASIRKYGLSIGH